MAFTPSKDSAQDRVLADAAERLLVTSPPGSGKTLTAVRLIARDVEAGRVGPTQRVLVLTFSRAARAQIDRYARALLTPTQNARAEITNYHSFFWSKIWQYRTSLGLPLDVELASEDRRRQDVLAAMAAAGLANLTARQQDQLAPDYSRALEFGLREGRPERLESQLERGDAVGEGLRQTHRAGRVHYDDMAYYMWRLTDSETLRALWAHKYPVVIVDEYQDSAPLQAAIVDRLAPPPHRLYAFADPLQLIYAWRDASKRRIDEFREGGSSEHELKTLHRYRHRPGLQAWMQSVRDVLLGDKERVATARPAEVQVASYDPNLHSKGEVYGAPVRELWQLGDPIAAGLNDLRSVGVLVRRRNQLGPVHRSLAKRFVCRHLKTADATAEWLRDWVDGFAMAATTGHHTERLLEVAARVAPAREEFTELRSRVGPDGIDTQRLRARKRAVADAVNELAGSCDTLPNAMAAARGVARFARHEQPPRAVAWDATGVIDRALRAHARLTDAEAADRARSRLLQLRMASAAHERRGVSLLTCHEGKGLEFDMVVIPFLSVTSFEDGDEEARQLLYVSLSRARHRIFVRVASGEEPEFAGRLGLLA